MAFSVIEVRPGWSPDDTDVEETGYVFDTEDEAEAMASLLQVGHGRTGWVHFHVVPDEL